MKSPYPIILDLTTKNVAVIGGGQVARRKIQKLIATGIKPTVISPVLNKQIDPATINWICDTYKRKYVEKMDIIITCTNDQKINDRVKTEANHFQLVNNTSNKKDSDFYNLATLSRDDVFISVSTLGKSPSTAKRVRKELKEWLSKQFHKEFK